MYSADDGAFCLLDWRGSFASQTEFGDLYYDLGKIYAGTYIQFNKIKNLKKEQLIVSSNNVKLGKLRTKNLALFESKLSTWIQENNYDLQKVKIIASLILMNIACLHEPYQANMLFFAGRRLIDESLKEI